MKPSKKLTPKQKRKLVESVWRQTERFIKDWQNSPYEWSNERDIQVELANRIKRQCESYGLKSVYAEYKSFWWLVEGYEKQHFNRVCCEPKTYCSADEDRAIRPDIVIFDDLQDCKCPPDVDGKGHTTGKNLPMLWLCEIKYDTGWRTNRLSKKSNWDFKKIRSLLKQADGTQYACWLNIARERGDSRTGVDTKILTHGRFRKYNVTLPAAMR